MKTALTVMFTVLIIFSMLYVSTITTAQGGAGKGGRILIILAPGFDPTINLTYTKTLKGIFNHSIVLRVSDSAPFNPLYHQLLLVNTTWDLRKAIPVENKVMVPNNSNIEPYEAVNETTISYIWGELDTMFIMFSPINPVIHPRAINPDYNTSGYIIPPTMIELKVNGTAKWDLLNTTIRITETEGGYKLKIENYVNNLTISNISMSQENILVNVTGNNQPLRPGAYYISVRLIKGENNTIIFFTPGTIKSSGWLSRYFGSIDRAFVVHLPVQYIGKLGIDDIKWVFSQIQESYTDILNKAFKYKGAIVNMIYFPLYQEAEEVITKYNITGEKRDVILNETMKALSSIIETARVSFGDTSMPVVIYSPYILEKNATLTPNTIVPGLYNITGNTTGFLETHPSAEIFRFGTSILAVDSNPASTGYMEGYLLLFKPGINGTIANLTVTPETIAPYLAAYAKGYGIGFKDLLEEISQKNSKISELRSEINKLNSNITMLKQQVEKLSEDKGQLQSMLNNQSIKIDQLQKQLDDAKTLKEQAYEYLLAGVSSIIVVIIILHILLRIAVSKGTGKPKGKPKK